MAINEHDREDLLRDGKMMPSRGEAVIDGSTVVIGFRSGGQVSLYIGADPVFQFNDRNQLRRAYVDGQRYAADKGQLVHLIPSQRASRLSFDQNSISNELTGKILDTLEIWIQRIRDEACSQEITWRLPGSSKRGLFEDQVTRWLVGTGPPIEVADSPNVGG